MKMREKIFRITFSEKGIGFPCVVSAHHELKAISKICEAIVDGGFDIGNFMVYFRDDILVVILEREIPDKIRSAIFDMFHGEIIWGHSLLYFATKDIEDPLK